MPEDPNAELSRQEYWDRRYAASASTSSAPAAAAAAAGTAAETQRTSGAEEVEEHNAEEEQGKTEDTYDWLRNFDMVRPFLEKHLPAASTEPRILHLGNGNSTLPASLLTHLHFNHQTAVDFSPVVTAQMQQKHPGITWQEMDIRALTYADATFDVCVDKATLDAMLYGSLWDPEEEVRGNVRRYVDEVARVLKPGGTWLYITWRQPHFIRPLIQREGVWTCEVETLEEPSGGGGGGMFEYFGWVCRKGS